MAMIETRNLHRSYRVGRETIEVLRGIDLSIDAGEKVFLCGPSGAGKTTLLYTLAGLERAQQGEVMIDGTALYALNPKRQAAFRNGHIGYIFQNYLLLPELTALENVMVPGAIAGADTTTQARRALERVGLGHRGEHLPAELSGGEQQRVAIARAVANHPKVLFADEPTGNLDQTTGAGIVEMLETLNREERTTLVLVTHDLSLAERADRVVALAGGRLASDRPGRGGGPRGRASEESGDREPSARASSEVGG